MPIFYKNDHRVFFSHIPKCAGSSIAAWFHASGWIVSNLYYGDDDVGNYFRAAGIHRLQIEGAQPKGVSPQHADAATTVNWGNFTSTFSIVRNPLDRFRSQLRYAAQRRLSEQESDEQRDDFAKRYFAEVVRKIAEAPWLEDNHFRPQREFVTSETMVLKFESPDWQLRLAKSFNLMGQPPQLLKGGKASNWVPTLTSEMVEWVLGFYAEDFEHFQYLRPTATGNE